MFSGERTRSRKKTIITAALAALAAAMAGCGGANQTSGQPTVGVAFETLQTEYWVASRNAIADELKKRNLTMLEAIADGDANRQFEQVNNFIARKVDGIIIVPKDAHTVIPMIKEANRANIPIVIFNRPPAKSDAKSVTVVADNYAIAKATVEYMVEQTRPDRKYKAAILIGDLGDINSIGRRDGFDDVVKQRPNIEVAARIPTEWNQEKALAGLTNALQANPDINFLFTSSDLLLPSIVSALKTAGKYKRTGEEGHVLLGSFDGDATAYRLLTEGYVDAVGVQDVYFDTAAAVQAVMDLRAGKDVPETILDKGFVIHRGNAAEVSAKMWGANTGKK